jgi:RNA polymerase sigma-70 factor (ECF subfamily)
MTKLFRDHSDFVARFLRRLGVAEADVDDLVQDVFVIAHGKGGYVAGQATPRSWLGAITVRVAANARRAQVRRREQACGECVLAAVDQSASPEDLAARRETVGRALRILERLDRPHREALLHDLQGQSCTEIAALLHVPVGTVHSRLHVARRRCKKAWARLVPTRPGARVSCARRPRPPSPR